MMVSVIVAINVIIVCLVVKIFILTVNFYLQHIHPISKRIFLLSQESFYFLGRKYENVLSSNKIVFCCAPRRIMKGFYIPHIGIS